MESQKLLTFSFHESLILKRNVFFRTKAVEERFLSFFNTFYITLASIKHLVRKPDKMLHFF